MANRTRALWRFALPALCVGLVAWAVSCSSDDGGGGDTGDTATLVALPALDVDCDWGNAGGGKASECGTSSTQDMPDVTARIKLATADCDNSADGTLALGESTLDCSPGGQNACVGTIDAWTDSGGTEALTELDAGEYLADLYIDTQGVGSPDVGRPMSCTTFTLAPGLETVTADFWMNTPAP